MFDENPTLLFAKVMTSLPTPVVFRCANGKISKHRLSLIGQYLP